MHVLFDCNFMQYVNNNQTVNTTYFRIRVMIAETKEWQLSMYL